MAPLLYLIRHGETGWNAERRYQGQRDIPLSEEGWRQARRLGRRLAGLRFDAVWSSDLGRARDTARCIAEPQGLPVRTHPSLREIDFGAWEGLTPEEIAERFPEEAAAYRDDPAHAVLPGGESMAGLQRRVVESLDQLLEGARERVAVVSHGLTIKVLLCHLMGWDLRMRARLVLDNTGVTIVRCRRDAPVLIRFNDVSHLRGGRRGAADGGRRGGKPGRRG